MSPQLTDLTQFPVCFSCIYGTGGGGGGLRGGKVSWENLVWKEGGEIFPWQNFGASAVQCRCWSFGIPRVAKSPPPEIFPGEITPIAPPPPQVIDERY